MPKQRVRFVVSDRGTARALLSVNEAPDGGLLVFLRGEKAAIVNDSKQLLRDFRISVHPSSNSRGTTITCHQRTEKSYHKHATFIHETDSFLLFPIVCRQCPDLRNSQYDASKPNSKDIILTVAEALPRFSTLTYVAFVAKSVSAFPSCAPYRLLTHSFNKFSLGIYSAYVNLPPLQFSAYATFQSSPDLGAVEATQRSVFGFMSFQPNQISQVCNTMMNLAGAQVIRHLQSVFAEGTKEREELDQHKVYWTTEPIEENSQIALVGNSDNLKAGLPSSVTWLARNK